ncbi:MAG: hypothetical protein ACNI27_12845 [Desulfovibrio sp.]
MLESLTLTSQELITWRVPAIALGADVFAAPSGRIQALPTTAGEYIKVGVAYEAAAEVGDLIEVLPNECGKVITVS